MIRALPARRSLPTLAILWTALLAAACTTSPSPAPSSGATATPNGTPGPIQTTGSIESAGPVETVGPVESPLASDGPASTVRIYLALGSFTGSGGLVPVERKVPVEAGGAADLAAIVALLAGPNEAELSTTPAMYTLMPEGTRLLELRVDDGIATVDFSGEYESGGGSASANGRLAQVVYTLTQFPHITGVRFEIDGTPVTTFSDARLDLSAPVDRLTYADQLPAIFVDEPAWGGTLANPASLGGLANVFEATFRFRLLDASGRSLADGPLMARCGTGCWGEWDATVPYAVPARGPGMLQVWEPSAVDGSPTNRTEYPVTLTP